MDQEVKAYTNNEGVLLYTAYCLDCKEVVKVGGNGERAQWVNGAFVEAAGRLHVHEHPTHQVIVGLTFYKGD